MTGESSLRAQGRRSSAPAGHARCSCDLLLSLCQDSDVQAALGGLADLATRRRGVAGLHAETDSEPADWRLRISQRSAGRHGAGELELLLAIVRSADCHAYQLLERAGVACSALRKRLIDQLREAENLAAHDEGTLKDGPDGPIFKSPGNGRWYPLRDADMSNKNDAVKWWNEKGREYGAKSGEVRDWMLESKNYTLEHFSINRSAGARLPDRYQNPLK